MALNRIEALLGDAQWLGGANPSGDDREALKALGDVQPSAASHPRTFAWYAIASKFTDAARAEWKGGDVDFTKEDAPAKPAAAAAADKPAAAGDKPAEGGKKKEKAKGPSQKELKKLERLKKKQEEEAKKN